MGEKRQFKFKRFALSELDFHPRNILGTIQYHVNTSTEINEEDKNDLRLKVSVKLNDSKNEEIFFSGNVNGHFSVGDNFGSFNLVNMEEKEMLQMVFDELTNIIYNLSSKAFDTPMRISLNAENLLNQRQLEKE